MNIPKILAYLRFDGADWRMGDPSDYATLEWLGVSSKPSLGDLQEAELAAEKYFKVRKIKTEAANRILSQWPDYAQRSAALGIYDSLPESDSFHPTNMKAGIAAIISAEHAAEDAINALEDPRAVEAFVW